MPNYKGSRYAAVFGAVGMYAEKVLKYSPIAYWPLWETSGSAAVCQINALQNGTYTGVTLNQDGIGDGNVCPLFDGANDYVSIGTATFYAAFNGNEGTLACWAKVANSGAWSDAVQRHCIYINYVGTYIYLSKSGSANELRCGRRAGGAFKSVDVSTTSTGWMHIAISWSVTGGALKVYYNGSQSGSTQTGLLAWGGYAPNNGIIGALNSTPQNVWNGTLAHIVIFDSALDATSVADLAAV